MVLYFYLSEIKQIYSFITGCYTQKPSQSNLYLFDVGLQQQVGDSGVVGGLLLLGLSRGYWHLTLQIHCFLDDAFDMQWHVNRVTLSGGHRQPD